MTKKKRGRGKKIPLYVAAAAASAYLSLFLRKDEERRIYRKGYLKGYKTGRKFIKGGSK